MRMLKLMRFPQSVHIIPIGDDDVERIVVPVEIGKPDRIYLITKKGKNLFGNIVRNSKIEIIKKGILNKENIIEVRCDIFDFGELIRIFAEIIRKESGNRVFFSLSTGGNLLSAAGMLSCVLFNAEPYFLIKDFKKNKIPTNPEILPFPKLGIDLPDKLIIKFLLSMKSHMDIAKEDFISKSQCLSIMEEFHPKEEFLKTSGNYNKLKFRYLDKLENRRYINIENKPRGKIRLTSDGQFALDIFATFYGL